MDLTWIGSMPEAYDRGLAAPVFAPFAADLATRAAAAAPRRVLELAAGTGVLTRALAAALPDAELTATDLSPGMVSVGSAAVPAARWQPADAQDIPFPDAAFDLVCHQFGIMFLPDRARGYAEMRRVLAPGGRLLFNTWDELGSHDFGRGVMDALERVFPGDPPTFFTDVPHGYADRDRIADDVRAAGFDHVEIETVTLVGHAPSAADVATGFCTGSPLRGQLEARGSLADLTEQVAAATTDVLGPGPLAGSMRAHVVAATR
jgi:SAM-dependent methyltransferase